MRVDAPAVQKVRVGRALTRRAVVVMWQGLDGFIMVRAEAKGRTFA